MPACHSPTRLSEANAAEIAELYTRCADYFLLQDGVAPSLPDARKLFRDVPPERNAHDQLVFGWRDDDGFYAVAAILPDYPRDGTWYLGLMLVDSEKRRRGIGRSVYEQVEMEAAAGGASEIRLAVLETNEGADRFWRSRGFSEIGRVGPDTFKMRSHYRIELSRYIADC